MRRPRAAPRSGTAGLGSCALAAVLALGAASPASGPEPGVTLEEVLALPTPSGVVAAPVGHAVAWLVNERGRRDVWVATGEPLRARAITAFAEDDGQALQDLAWLPDGRAVVFVKGNAAGASGAPLNPASRVDGAIQEVWTAPVDGSGARRLGPGYSPAVSASGRVAFVRGDEVWETTPGAKPLPAAVIFRPHGQLLEMEWSPDGSALAFAVRRGAHSLIGVYRRGKPSLEYVAPSVDRDLYPRWARDGRSLAFVRMENAEATMRSTGRYGPIDSRWALMLSERSAGGTFGPAREVWRAPPRPLGSFPRTFPLLRWAGGRLLFSSEHEDWLRLYLVDAAVGSEPVALTPAGCEVDDVSLDAAGRRLVASTNCGDPERRRLWTALLDPPAAAPGPLRPLTNGDVVDTTPALLADGSTVVFSRTDARTPPAVYVQAVAGGRPEALAPAAAARELSARRWVGPEVARFEAEDGLTVHAVVLAPGAAAPGRRPALVHVHGGPTSGQELLGWQPVFQAFAARGYVVLGLNYRGGSGYGRPFRELLAQGPAGAVEYQDVVAAARYLRSRPDVDPARIGIFGTSYGGYLTQLALARNSDLFAAGVTECGPFDLSLNTRSAATRGGEAARLAQQSSAAGAVDGWRSPVLVIHGDDDPGVDFDVQTLGLVKALRARQVPLELLVLPDEGHGSSVWAHALRVRQATLDFFDRRLAASRPGAAR